ncbi:MAG: DUF3626 domain-containing protein [Trebonia sp.]
MTQSHELAIAHVAGLAGGGPADPAWRVTLHFHPDRLFGGVPILRRMADDGVYRSQFETGTSNGGLTAFPGGDRWRWESRIFGRAYDDGPAAARPKYGALNFRRRVVGGSPRFGSAHLRVTASVMERATFCYPDSFGQPEHFGVAARVSPLVAMAAADDTDPLDDYVEAHVHGPLDLSADVEAVVLDPCYLGTPVEIDAQRLACPVEWHGGFRVTTQDLRRNAGYRAPGFAELGASIARSGYLDPGMIGDASRAGHYDEQALKRVWHYVARFGSREMRDARARSE